MRRMAQAMMAAAMAMGLVALWLTTSAVAADLKPRITAVPGHSLPFARSERAQAVWASAPAGATAALMRLGQTQCLYRDSQGQCLKLTDDCDRYCQRSCRSSGGPYLPLDF